MKEYYLLGALACLLFLWNITLVSVDTVDGIAMRGHLASDVVNQYANIQGIDANKIILYKIQGHVRTINSDILLSGGRWLLGARPVAGDHIHAAISFYVGKTPILEPFHDRDPIENILYEKKTKTCKIPGQIAYTKMWPHCGVHTHCDGLIHIHPWSAPASVRKEGLDIRLQLWFDQVGIEYRESPLISLQFPNGLRLDGNQTHRWYVSEKKCFKDTESIVYDKNINQIWLGNAYASYVVWFGKIGSRSPPSIATRLELLSEKGASGYNGQKYPQTCL